MEARRAFIFVHAKIKNKKKPRPASCGNALRTHLSAVKFGPIANYGIDETSARERLDLPRISKPKTEEEEALPLASECGIHKTVTASFWC